MEGELSNTIEAIDGVDTAIVHLALPEKQVFADEQDPATASVLVDTSAGTDLDAEQVQAIVNLVASSIDGLDPEKVTVADADGRVLSANDGSGGPVPAPAPRPVEDFQTDIQTRVQAMLDRVVGPGNSTLTVTADLDFDKAVTETTTYSANPDLPALSESESSETYTGPAGAAAGGGASGVVGPDGQMDSGADRRRRLGYEKQSATRDNPVDSVVERRENAPGSPSNICTSASIARLRGRAEPRPGRASRT